MAKVAILGMGLIGGSVALALKGEHEVVGSDVDGETRDLAREAGIACSAKAEEAVADADLVVLAVPIPALPKVVVNLAGRIGKGAVVTDVGGVKRHVVDAARRHLPDGSFVGGHPMAGSVGRGFGDADAGLFRGASWALTPETDAERAGAARIKALLAPTGARFVDMAPSAHDRAVAFTSHIPYLTALALARAAQSASREGLPHVDDLLGPGFRDSTRLALTPADLGQAMAIENEEAVLLGLAALRYQLAQFEVLIQNKMGKEFKALAQGIHDWRAKY
ncbi:MAG: prephenate dehydrogenase [Candidatus Sericytochromatia bacterium]|nr:prephenate dehydrogenase [Candidatus Tanganyikabacteria bacterium]